MVSIEYLTIADVKKRKWKSKDIIDWLIDSDVHFVLTHIHQGLDQLNWSMSELYYNEVDQRLLKHKGFPETLCPIWIQAKYDYLKALFSEDMANKTVRVDIRNELNLAKIREDLKVLHPHLEVKTKYIVKTEFSTNKANLKFAKNEDEVLGRNVYLLLISSLYHDYSLLFILYQIKFCNCKEIYHTNVIMSWFRYIIVIFSLYYIFYHGKTLFYNFD